MGTLADEMTKVLSEWDKQDEEIKQEESTVKNMFMNTDFQICQKKARRKLIRRLNHYLNLITG